MSSDKTPVDDLETLWPSVDLDEVWPSVDLDEVWPVEGLGDDMGEEDEDE